MVIQVQECGETDLYTLLGASYHILSNYSAKKNNLRHHLALKLEHKNYTSVSAATYMTVHWCYN